MNEFSMAVDPAVRQPLRFAFILIAPPNVSLNVSRDDMIHKLSPAPVNSAAPANIESVLLTFRTSHLDRSWTAKDE